MRLQSPLLTFALLLAACGGAEERPPSTTPGQPDAGSLATDAAAPPPDAGFADASPSPDASEPLDAGAPLDAGEADPCEVLACVHGTCIVEGRALCNCDDGWEGQRCERPSLPRLRSHALGFDAADRDSFGFGTHDRALTWRSTAGGVTAVAPTEQAAPVLWPTLVNGRPGLMFDGANDLMLVTNFTRMSGEDRWSFFAVVEPQGALQPIFVVTTNQGTPVILVATGGTGTQVGAAHAPVGGNSPVLVASPEGSLTRGPHLVSVVNGDHGLIVRLDGVQVAAVPYDGAGTPVLGLDAGVAWIGGATALERKLGGSLAELHFFSDALREETMAQVEAYLMAKWGLE